MDSAILLASVGAVVFVVVQLLKNTGFLDSLAKVIAAAIGAAAAFVAVYAWSKGLLTQQNAFDLLAAIFTIAATASGIHAASDVNHVA